MSDNDEELAESAWREGFRQRLRQVQGDRTQEDMADLLCISRDAYSKYVGARASRVPIRLLSKLAKIGAVSLEWLIEGDKSSNVATAKQAKVPKQSKRKLG